MESLPRMLRSLAFAAGDLAGLPSMLSAEGPRMLLYHGATRESGAGIFNYRHKFVNTDSFREQMQWVAQHYKVYALADFLASLNTQSLEPHAIAITFDDGYYNNYSDAFPILRDLKIPATFFITTGFIDGAALPVDTIEHAITYATASHITAPVALPLRTRRERIFADLTLKSFVKRLQVDEANTFIDDLVKETTHDLRTSLMDSPYRPLTWGQIQEMEENGMTFAAHTVTHPMLGRLPSDTAQREIRGSRDVLASHIKNPLDVFAYPNGGKSDYTDATIELLKGEGYTAALTTEPSTITRNVDRFRIPRFTMDGASDTHRARFMVSGAYTRLARL